MGEEREYLKQVNKDLIKVFTKKTEAVMVEWVDTEDGRDEHQSWERVVHGGLVVYINNYDRSSKVYGKEDFLIDLEAIYNLGLAKIEKIKEQEKTQQKFSLDFIKWYSGMKEEQILNAHKRWIKEENNGKH